MDIRIVFTCINEHESFIFFNHKIFKVLLRLKNVATPNYILQEIKKTKNNFNKNCNP